MSINVKMNNYNRKIQALIKVLRRWAQNKKNLKGNNKRPNPSTQLKFDLFKDTHVPTQCNLGLGSGSAKDVPRS